MEQLSEISSEILIGLAVVCAFLSGWFVAETVYRMKRSLLEKYRVDLERRDHEYLEKVWSEWAGKKQ